METLAPYGWRQARSVGDALFEEAHLFPFLQAVRLLEQLRPLSDGPGEGIDPSREVVRFAHEVRFDFAAEDVAAIERRHGRIVMRTNVLGLAGVHGPLPQAVSETLFRQPRDDAFHDFLDIFNHRLISLLFRARAKYRPALDRRAPEGGRVANVLYAMLGLGTPNLRERTRALSDRALLAYAGLFAERARSETGLVSIVEDLFEVAVEVVPFQGRRYPIEEDDVTRIGRTRRGQNQQLGRGAVLGTHVWEQTAAFELRLGPLTLAQFRGFLPDGSAHAALLAAVRFYIQPELEFTVRLALRSHEVPELRLGKQGRARLGWTSWLVTRQRPDDDSQVRLKGGK